MIKFYFDLFFKIFFTAINFISFVLQYSQSLLSYIFYHHYHWNHIHSHRHGDIQVSEKERHGESRIVPNVQGSQGR